VSKRIFFSPASIRKDKPCSPPKENFAGQHYQRDKSLA
jgi:hypothetical protein